MHTTGDTFKIEKSINEFDFFIVNDSKSSDVKVLINILKSKKIITKKLNSFVFPSEKSQCMYDRVKDWGKNIKSSIGLVLVDIE